MHVKWKQCWWVVKKGDYIWSLLKMFRLHKLQTTKHFPWCPLKVNTNSNPACSAPRNQRLMDACSGLCLKGNENTLQVNKSQIWLLCYVAKQVWEQKQSIALRTLLKHQDSDFTGWLGSLLGDPLMGVDVSSLINKHVISCLGFLILQKQLVCNAGCTECFHDTMMGCTKSCSLAWLPSTSVLLGCKMHMLHDWSIASACIIPNLHIITHFVGSCSHACQQPHYHTNIV